MGNSRNGDSGLHKGLTSYGDRDFSLFLRKAFIKGAGYSDEALERPIVGIANTGSAYNPCHGNTPQLVDAVKRGVMLAGGLPMEFPIISIHESFASPTSMYLRNLMSIDTEEMIRAQPMDAVVLIGGCDKTVPAQLMGAASAGIPAIQLVTGSMLTGAHQGVRVGACTDCRRYWGRYRAEEIDADEISRVLGKSVSERDYPRLARQQNWQGTTEVRLQIGSDGKVKDVVVGRTSGYDLLDQRAIQLVKQLRLPKIPSAFRQREFTVTVPITFALRNS